ncbi:hypothetical protein FOA52_012604 [Chlamydomonas sp. UWO 241]|nr:hypothetical protein FOA52_012604 [Chlamydomonas sp. UWO 241]
MPAEDLLEDDAPQAGSSGRGEGGSGREEAGGEGGANVSGRGGEGRGADSSSWRGHVESLLSAVVAQQAAHAMHGARLEAKLGQMSASVDALLRAVLEGDGGGGSAGAGVSGGSASANGAAAAAAAAAAGTLQLTPWGEPLPRLPSTARRSSSTDQARTSSVQGSVSGLLEAGSGTITGTASGPLSPATARLIESAGARSPRPSNPNLLRISNQASFHAMPASKECAATISGSIPLALPLSHSQPALLSRPGGAEPAGQPHSSPLAAMASSAAVGAVALSPVPVPGCPSPSAATHARPPVAAHTPASTPAPTPATRAAGDSGDSGADGGGGGGGVGARPSTALQSGRMQGAAAAGGTAVTGAAAAAAAAPAGGVCHSVRFTDSCVAAATAAESPSRSDDDLLEAAYFGGEEDTRGTRGVRGCHALVLPPTPTSKTGLPDPNMNMSMLGRLAEARSKETHDSADGLGELSERSRLEAQTALWMAHARRAGLYLFWDIWEPDSLFRKHWDYLILLLMVYVVIITPYLIAFEISTTDMSAPITIIDLSINSLFLLDVCLNFRTSYPDPEVGMMISDRKKVAVNYVWSAPWPGWFWFDTLTSLPYDQMVNMKELSAAKSIKVLRIFRILRLLKMAKLARVMSNVNVRSAFRSLEDMFGKATMRMGQLLLLAIGMLHWGACLFYYSAAWQDFNDETWVWRADLVPNEYSDGDANNAKRYIYALYWSVVSMTTVGYGDITPVSVSEKVIAIFIIIAGASLFAYFMGSMTSLIACSDSHSARLARKKAAVDDFLRDRKMPNRLSEKVRTFYNYTVARTVRQDEAEIIAGLSMGLRMQVVLHLYRQALEKVPFFRGKPPQFITSLVTRLKLEYFSPGDIVVRQGETGHEMFFVGEGALAVRVYSHDLDRRAHPDGTKNEGKGSFAYGDNGAGFFDNGDAAESGSGSGGGTSKAQGAAACLHGLGARLGRALTLGAGRKPPGGGGGGGGGAASAHVQPNVYLQNDDLAHLEFTEVGALSAGESFGTYSCLLGEPRAATVLAMTYCELYCLKRADLEEVVAQWPELADEFKQLVNTTRAQEEEVLYVREQMGLVSPSAAALGLGVFSSHFELSSSFDGMLADLGPPPTGSASGWPSPQGRTPRGGAHTSAASGSATRGSQLRGASASARRPLAPCA